MSIKINLAESYWKSTSTSANKSLVIQNEQTNLSGTDPEILHSKSIWIKKSITQTECATI